MSLRDRMQNQHSDRRSKLLEQFGVLANPYPSANQTYGNPHSPVPEDTPAEDRILAFLREQKSEVLVVIGTQGVGKTNLLNYLEREVVEAKSELDGFYIVRYMADPEQSFDGVIRTVFQELGIDHLKKVVKVIASADPDLSMLRSYDLRQALLSLSKKQDDDDLFQLCLNWFFGFRILNAHRNGLGISFRLDTVESRTTVLRDYVLLSTELGVLKGIFLLLDELEKQAGILSPRAVVRYLSALRAIIDALPKFLFMVIAMTPDAMRRYGSALPAFRRRLDNQILLSPLGSPEQAQKLARFYLERARIESAGELGTEATTELISDDDTVRVYGEAEQQSKDRGDDGVRQRDFLNRLHNLAETRLRPE